MSKSKKKKEKESKEEKGFAIPSFPDFAFVIELEDVVLVTGETITECVFPHYRFETTTSEGCDKAFKAAEEIANAKKQNVVDALNFPLDDPQAYDPIEREKQQTNFMHKINTYRAEIRENWRRKEKLGA